MRACGEHLRGSHSFFQRKLNRNKRANAIMAKTITCDIPLEIFCTVLKTMENPKDLYPFRLVSKEFLSLVYVVRNAKMEELLLLYQVEQKGFRPTFEYFLSFVNEGRRISGKTFIGVFSDVCKERPNETIEGIIKADYVPAIGPILTILGANYLLQILFVAIENQAMKSLGNILLRYDQRKLEALLLKNDPQLNIDEIRTYFQKANGETS